MSRRTKGSTSGSALQGTAATHSATKTEKRPGTPIPTPDLDVTLAKRMRKRFSSRHGNSTMLSDTSSLSSVSSALSQSQGPSLRELSMRLSQKKPKRKASPAAASVEPLGSRLASATIDKTLEPDQTPTAVSSPARFERSKGTDMEESESSAGEVSGPEEAESSHTRKTRGTRADEETAVSTENLPRNRSGRKRAGSNESGARESTDECSATESNDATTRMASIRIGSSLRHTTSAGLPLSSSQSDSVAGSQSDSVGGSQSDSGPEGPAKDPEGLTTTTSPGQSDDVKALPPKGQERAGEAVDKKMEKWSTLCARLGQTGESSSEDSRRRAVESSTGIDSDVSLSDQQFVHSQVKIISSPFSLEAGPGDWIAAWKRKNRSDEEEEEENIPKHVVNRALSKLNKSMVSMLRVNLSRGRQRAVFKELVDVRERERSCGDSLIQTHVRAMEDKLVQQPDKVLASLPETWTDADSQSDDLKQNYSRLRASVMERVESFVARRQQLVHNQMLVDHLLMMSGMEVPSSQELESELERSRNLVSEVVKKLDSNNYRRRVHSPHKTSPRKTSPRKTSPRKTSPRKTSPRKTSPNLKPADLQLRPLQNSHALLTAMLFNKAGPS